METSKVSFGQYLSGSLALDDLNHLVADLLDLRSVRVRRLADLVGCLLGEANAEAAQSVAVRRLDVNHALE